MGFDFGAARRPPRGVSPAGFAAFLGISFDGRLAKIIDVRKSSRAKRQPQPVKKPKNLFWIGSALKDFSEFPAAIRPQVGFNLRFAQNGESGEDVKTLQGFGSAHVKEIVSNTQGDTFRTVYTIEFEHAVYVLHCFQKKSHQGTKTDKADLDLVRNRLKAAEAAYKKQFP